MRRVVRRILVRGITASILLPMIVGLVVGLGALLSSLGDDAGASFCVRVAQIAGVGWLLAVATTAVTAGTLAVAEESREWRAGPRLRPRGRRRRPGKGHRRHGNPFRRDDAPPRGSTGDSGLG